MTDKLAKIRESELLRLKDQIDTFFATTTKQEIIEHDCRPVMEAQGIIQRLLANLSAPDAKEGRGERNPDAHRVAILAYLDNSGSQMDDDRIAEIRVILADEDPEGSTPLSWLKRAKAKLAQPAAPAPSPAIDDLLLQEIYSLREKLKIAVAAIKADNPDFDEQEFTHQLNSVDLEQLMEELAPEAVPAPESKSWAEDRERRIYAGEVLLDTPTVKESLTVPAPEPFVSKENPTTHLIEILPNPDYEYITAPEPEGEEPLRAQAIIELMRAENNLAEQEQAHGDGWLSDHAAVIRDLAAELARLSPPSPKEVPDDDYNHPAFRILKDGSAFVAILADFKNLQESQAGYGDTPQGALANLIGVPPPPSGSMAAKDARELLAKLRKGTGHVAPGEHHPFAPTSYWVEWDLSIHDALMAIQDYAARGQEGAERYQRQFDDMAANEVNLTIAYDKQVEECTVLRNHAEQTESEAKALREAAKPLVDAYLCNPDSTSEFVAYRSGKEVIAEWHALRAALRKDEAEKGGTK